jgi:hypothetical protein
MSADDKRSIQEDVPLSSAPEPVGADDAIDDTDDLDDEHVEIQKTISNSRKRHSLKNGDIKVQDVLPFPFLPNIRPLTVSDLESCVALENSAFTDPNHRCSREKVSYHTCVNIELLRDSILCIFQTAKKSYFELQAVPFRFAVFWPYSDCADTYIL